MKLGEFNSLFPKANKKYFRVNEDGDVLYNGEDDVEEPAFWGDFTKVKKLNLGTEDIGTYLFSSNENFLSIYKNIHKYKKSQLKSYWKPQEWSFSNDKIPEIVLKLQDIDLWNFRIYVNDKDYFMLHDNIPYNFDISEIDFNDSKNEYCLILKAMYILSYIGGVSIQNLKSKNNLARSLAYFYFYYHLKKIYNYRDIVDSGYDLEPLFNVDLFKSLYNWSNHHVHFYPHMKMGDSEFKRNKHDVIANVHKDGKWIKWQLRGAKRDITNDYLKLINTMGNGITKTGQLLLQESSQAYVYCILGAQAKTHWKILGDGANSLQTQSVFKKLISEILAQNNLSYLIKSMRLAIKSTNVRLNFCISPGLELLPSDMIYIKDSPGYNNILTISGSNFNFGTNTGVNSTLNKTINSLQTNLKIETNKIQAENKQKIDIAKSDASTSSNTPEILGASLLLAIAGRLIWLAL